MALNARNRAASRATQRSTVGRAQLAGIAERAGVGPIDFEDHGDSPETLLEGRLQIRRLPAGVEVHVTDATETTDLTSRTLLGPGLTVSLLLEGEIDATLGGRAVAFQADDAAAGRLWTFATPLTLVRRLTRGRRIRKVNVSVPRAWVEDLVEEPDGAAPPYDIGSLFAEGVTLRAWTPSPAAVRYAEQLLGPHWGDSPMSTLSAQISAIGLLQEALAQTVPAPDDRAAGGLAPRTVARARAARRYLLQHLDDELSLPGIARDTGMSVSTLQRVFRVCYGVTVIEFLRGRRLERARDALDRDGISVAQAARQAGYRSAANFATAFTRAFGYPPSLERRRPGRGER